MYELQVYLWVKEIDQLEDWCRKWTDKLFGDQFHIFSFQCIFMNLYVRNTALYYPDESWSADGWFMGNEKEKIFYTIKHENPLIYSEPLQSIRNGTHREFGSSLYSLEGEMYWKDFVNLLERGVGR